VESHSAAKADRSKLEGAASKDQFSPAELAELFILEQSEINQQFEIWMTVTFAVIVASFVAGERLVQRLRVVVATLCVLSVNVNAASED
jgi:hypothetical protein